MNVDLSPVTQTCSGSSFAGGNVITVNTVIYNSQTGFADCTAEPMGEPFMGFTDKPSQAPTNPYAPVC